MFRLLNPSILQKAKVKTNRAFKSGSSSLKAAYDHKYNSKISLVTLCLSLFLVGSCNETSAMFDFSQKRVDLKEYTKAELVRHAYALQLGLLQDPKNIKKLEADDVKLVFSEPDLMRKDGRNNVWQYRTQSCVLDVHWKDKKYSNPVSHYEFRQRRSVLDGTQAVEEPTSWKCVQTIIQDRRRNIERGFSYIYADLPLKAHKS